MGLIGLGFFMSCVYLGIKLLRVSYKKFDNQSIFITTIGLVVVFGAVSITLEILYHRYFWFIIGMAVASATMPPWSSKED